ncbi:MAG: glycosyltransferase involved in cell wall biosynthesis [Psychromonas sp.]|jgi:glycosyltransferase involved in cell wall biosynthesis|uniref:glycosyltransferase n=1 Tax=Psychromonas sp. TaxID=1884585 RepID=UPI0039E385CD
MNTVIQVVQHLRPGGIETLSLDLCSFAEANENILIVSLEGELESALAAWPRLIAFRKQLIFLDKQPGLCPSTVKKLIRVIKENAAQCVHSHHIGPLLYAGLAARIAGVKELIHTEHDAWHLDAFKRRMLQRFAIKLLRPLLVADAQTVADSMRQQLQYKRPIRVIRNGIDSEYFLPGDKLLARAQLKLPAKVQIIGCSGRMEEVKGQALLLHALHKLPLTAHLALAGSGSTEKKLRQLTEQLGLQERVHFLGHIDTMPTFYQALDVFCLPSLAEGLPLSPLEAQACNIVTLVTDVGGSKETLCPHSGKFIPANNRDLMAKTLLKMLRSPGNVKPRAYVQQHGDVRVMAKAYADLRRPNEIKGACYE